VNESRSVVVALDVGGTAIKCGLVDRSGGLGAPERHPTGAERGPDAVVQTVVALAGSLAEKARANGLSPVAVGVVVPGAIDEAGGIARWSANVGFRDVPLRSLVAAATGLPAALGHDVRGGGLAEARWGAGRGFRQVLFMPIGTGIAAAHVVNGVAFSGAHGAAGEIGHVIVKPDGAPCRCGARGCLEAVASASAVARRYADLTGVKVDAATVSARAASGESVAAQVWVEAVAALASGVLTAITLYDPEVVVVGGGMAGAGGALLDPLVAQVRSRLTFQTEPLIVAAALGDEAGCLGAGLLGWEALA
jgi:glucokinase